MDNKYTFKDFLADLKKWQSENLPEYYRFLGLLGQEELRIMNVFFGVSQADVVPSSSSGCRG